MAPLQSLLALPPPYDPVTLSLLEQVAAAAPPLPKPESLFLARLVALHGQGFLFGGPLAHARTQTQREH